MSQQVTVEFSRVDAEGTPTVVGRMEADFTSFNLGESGEFACEQLLRQAYAQEPGWAPGNYRVVATLDLTGREIARLEGFPLPLLPGWSGLDYAERRHAYQLKTTYGLTFDQLAEHRAAYSDHYTGRIDDAELTARTSPAARA